jgi:hypothetical protein
MQRIRAVQTGRDHLGDPLLALKENLVVTPEFVEEGLASKTNIPTNFYPDVSLWEGIVTAEHWSPETPSAMCGSWVDKPIAPVENYFAPVSSRSVFEVRHRDSGTEQGARLSNMPSRRQQAKEGDTQIGSEATYVPGEQAAGEVAKDVQDAIK